MVVLLYCSAAPSFLDFHRWHDVFMYDVTIGGSAGKAWFLARAAVLGEVSPW